MVNSCFSCPLLGEAIPPLGAPLRPQTYHWHPRDWCDRGCHTIFQWAKTAENIWSSGASIWVLMAYKPSLGNKNHNAPKGHGKATCPINTQITCRLVEPQKAAKRLIWGVPRGGLLNTILARVWWPGVQNTLRRLKRGRPNGTPRTGKAFERFSQP